MQDRRNQYPHRLSCVESNMMLGNMSPSATKPNQPPVKNQVCSPAGFRVCTSHSARECCKNIIRRPRVLFRVLAPFIKNNKEAHPGADRRGGLLEPGALTRPDPAGGPAPPAWRRKSRRPPAGRRLLSGYAPGDLTARYYRLLSLPGARSRSRVKTAIRVTGTRFQDNA